LIIYQIVPDSAPQVQEPSKVKRRGAWGIHRKVSYTLYHHRID